MTVYDHNHFLKRIATCVRGGNNDLDYEAFGPVLADKTSGLTHAALTGQRKQSTKDAERLSYLVVEVGSLTTCNCKLFKYSINMFSNPMILLSD